MREPVNGVNEQWLEHSEKRFIFRDMEYKLETSVLRAIYPYEHLSISVDGTPVNRESAEYRTIRSLLGDDWVLDVLSLEQEDQEIIWIQVSS